MQTVTQTIATSVHEVLEAQGPIASVWMRTGARAEGESALNQRHLIASLLDQGADARTLRVVHDQLSRLTKEPGVEAVYVSGDRVLGVFRLSGAQTPEAAVYAEVPRILPVLSWFQQRPAHVVALVDRAGADLLSWSCGAHVPDTVVVTGPDDEIERNAPGGVAQMRYQRRAEDSWQHNAAAVARQIVETLERDRAELLLLSGDQHAVRYVQDHLPARIPQQVRVVHIPGGRAVGEPARRQDERVASAVGQAVEAETARLVDAVADGLGAGGLGVDGVQATVEALAAVRVRTLLVTDDPGDRRTLWVGPGAADIADRRSPRPGGWPLVREAPVADAAVRCALLTGADVRILAPGGAAAPAEGIAALCRFA